MEAKSYHCKKIKISSCQITDHQISVSNQFMRESLSWIFVSTNCNQGSNIFPGKFVDVGSSRLVEAAGIAPSLISASKFCCAQKVLCTNSFKNM